jgi:predicted enzyme related to lactoylglutathione lyase
MVNDIESISVFSENATKLADFYKKKVGLKSDLEGDMGEKGKKIFGFDANGRSGFYVIDHSKVKGKNKDPERHIINFEVANIEDEVKKLDKNGVRKIQDTYHMEGYGLIATFEDPDGNYFQLVQVKA